jgi:glycerophosphoryl diester phosphodiesterase
MFKFAILCLALFPMACNSVQTPILPPKNFDVEGHRGCRGLMPENTIPAMLKAIELGVTTLEMDAAISKDSQVIISHDPFFNHVISTKPDGSSFGASEDEKYKLYEMNYSEIEQWDVGLKFNSAFPAQQKIRATKPRLEDLIDSVETLILRLKLRPVHYNIETKTTPAGDGIYHPEPARFVDLLMDVILRKGIQDRVIIQSFDMRTLKLIHHIYPAIRTALLIDGTDLRPISIQLSQLGFIPSIYSPQYLLVNAPLIAYCHSRRMQIIPWTVNDSGAISRLIAMGVDGIITDFPDLFKTPVPD